METLQLLDRSSYSLILSHSLGKLIEWKPKICVLAQGNRWNLSHSLGKLIEWKLIVVDLLRHQTITFPLAGKTN